MPLYNFLIFFFSQYASLGQIIYFYVPIIF